MVKAMYPDQMAAEAAAEWNWLSLAFAAVYAAVGVVVYLGAHWLEETGLSNVGLYRLYRGPGTLPAWLARVGAYATGICAFARALKARGAALEAGNPAGAAACTLLVGAVVLLALTPPVLWLAARRRRG